MGRKKKLLVVEDPEEEDDKETVPGLEDEKELEKLRLTEEWLTEFQERFSDQPVKVLVEKYDAAGDWCYCRKYPLAGFDQDVIRDDFGGGKYRASLFGVNGRYIKEGRHFFKFEEPLKQGPVAVKPENPLENPVVAMMLKAMESNQKTVVDMMTAMITSQSAAKPATGLGEIVEVMKGLNGLAPKAEKPFENFKETLGLMKLLKEATGDKDGESKGGLLGDIKDFLEIYPTIKDQLSNLKPALPAAVPVGPALGVVGGAEPERKTTIMDPLSRKIIDLVPHFVGGARANAPAPEWAAYLLGELDTGVMPILLPVMKEKYKPLVNDEDDVYDILLKLAKDPAEREKIYLQIPPLAGYKDWMNRVIDEAVRLEELPEVPESSEVVLSAVTGNGKEE